MKFGLFLIADLLQMIACKLEESDSTIQPCYVVWCCHSIVNGTRRPPMFGDADSRNVQ